MLPVLLLFVLPVVPGHFIILLASFRIRDMAEVFWFVWDALFLALFSEQPLLFFKSLFFNCGGLKVAVFEGSLIGA